NTSIYTLSLHDALPISMNLARDLSERMRANKSGLSKSITVTENEIDKLVDAYSNAMSGKYYISSHTPNCIGSTKCSSKDFAQERSEEHTSELQSREKLV